MKAPEFTSNELGRQAALVRSGLLDTSPEERFDRLTRMARRIFGVPIALVTLVDRNRQWFKSCQGLDVPQTPRDISFCGHAILHSDLLVIEDALNDERFHDNPLVTKVPHIRFYAGAPLHSADGFRLGTLCIIDQAPRRLSGDDRILLRELADCVEREINLQAASEFYQNLKQSERRARAVIDGTRVGTWEWNIQTGETVFNERWAQICGYRLEELEPVSIQTWLNLAHPEDLRESERLLMAHFAGDLDEYDCRCRMQHKNGHWVWVHDRGRVFEWTEDGQPLRMYGTHADVSAEMANLQKMQQQNTALSILNDLALDPETDDDARIRKALRLGAEYLDMPLAIVSEITSSVYTVLWFNAPEDAGLEEGLSFSLPDTYCSIMVEQDDSLAIEHMARSPYRDHPCYELFGLESYVAAPIYLHDRLFGTLNFSSPEPREQGFSETEVTFVTLLARWVAGVLERRISVQTLTKLVEQTPGMLYQYRLWPDGSSAFPFSGPGIREIYGVESEEVSDDASPVFSRIHPDDLATVGASITASAQQLSVWQQQYRTRRGDGEWRWVEGRATPELLADKSIMWHGYIADIDDKKRIQLALQESEDELRRLFELSPIGIALNDFHQVSFLDVNQALLEPTGYTREEFMVLDFQQLLPEGEFTGLRGRALSELEESGRFGPFEQDIVRKDNSTYPAVIQGLLITNASGRTLVWSLIEDISERKKVEQMKNEFISTVSHELRTPLTSIAGSLGLIAGGALGALPEQVDRMIAIAARNSDQLKQLIDDLLDMEKLVSGKMKIRLQRQTVSPLIEDCIDRMRTYAVDRVITVRFDDHHPDQELPVDSHRLDQALANLLSNAIKFSPAHSEVIVGTRLDRGEFRIQVSDQGPGIPNNFRHRIFQKFAQADSSNTRGRGGTGLGLAITREIMTQMGGGVGFESTEGRGASFWLEIPTS
ncbi:PAS domain-containing protein [Marinobacter sp. M216]|uniref:histidine kinase n=1 Tax=Marinobacter albus TaxID=3030833 RepID=A0ABT7H7A7_9GAMM|nr:MULTISPECIES: PAS domain-containing protein [unclassified Marinobacter]MBW7471466.1 PAS domain-containing protein [Marinobacter sp. F4218]MDK9556256.1 PAS domain-containing protein [Marinobacter sp. M216]